MQFLPRSLEYVIVMLIRKHQPYRIAVTNKIMVSFDGQIAWVK